MKALGPIVTANPSGRELKRVLDELTDPFSLYQDSFAPLLLAFSYRSLGLSSPFKGRVA